MVNKILNTALSAVLIIFCFILTGCVSGHLSVHTDYLSEESLASYHVNTPDLRRCCPPLGQRLILSWSLPKQFFCYEDLHLNILLRYRNRETNQQTLPLSQKSGTHIIYTLNEDYSRTGGILTYHIELVGDDQILETWTHPIWANLIELKPLKPLDEPAEELSDFSDWDLDDSSGEL